ncbi:MAG TPA: SRPBCC family protein [Tepidisphaeraceae bacterium]|nr:SRPBCC family protein [Tepidisphaeraceae bacterium]
MAMYIAIAIAVLIVAALVIIANRPNTFRVARSAEIDGSPDVVFPLINDFHQWLKWSPWEKLDPNMKKTFEGPPAGTGSSYAWDGNKKAGAGKCTITQSKTNELVVIRLEMLKPFPADNQVTFTFAPAGSNTRVTWAMDGKCQFMTKAFSLICNMDKMIGKDFEEGLSNLDRLAKAQKQPIA